MNFLITNMTGFRNKGCEGMTKVIITEVKRRFPEARFMIFSNDPKYDELWISDKDSVIFSTTPPAAPWKGLLRKVRRFPHYVRRYSEDLSPFAWADGVISTGGDVFSSEYGGLKRHLKPIHDALRRKKPVCLLSHSIGPFKKHSELKLFTRAAERLALITLRESLSLEYVKRMGLRNPRVELTADPAFLLKSADDKLIEKLWYNYGLPVDRPVIGLAVSQGIAGYAGCSREEHFSNLKSIIRFVIEKMGFHILLIPHVQERQIENDDRILCEWLWRELGFTKDVTVISHLHSAEEIKGLIGRCTLVIAERMHATIAALSQEVASLVVGYSVKAEGILKDMLGEELGRMCLISIRDCTEPALQERLMWISNNAEMIRKTLARSLPTIRQRALLNFDLLEEVLRPVIRK
ncbi:MAG: polysaccharide pyruvyl transferase family protein [Firmicutes bacterium]|nr:polysaccharide pyruvyl transferase family protein [Bacillota bacterium]